MLKPSEFICITEGSLDTMWLDQLGYTSVALLGAHMSKMQEDLLINLPTKELVICLDNDEAGINASEDMLTRLSNRCIVSVINIPKTGKGYKDVQDIKDREVLAKIIKQRKLL